MKMTLEQLYGLHTDPSQLFGIEIYPYKMFIEALPERKETMEETGEILNHDLKKWIKIMPHPDKEIEQFLLTDEFTSNLIMTYASSVLKERWLEGEQKIVHVEDPYAARRYAMMFNFRFTDAEPFIAQYPEHAFYYATDVIEGRFLEAEPYIKNDPIVRYDYADEWGLNWEDEIS